MKPRAVSAFVVWAILMGSPLFAWNSVQFKIVDIGSNPLKKAVVTFVYANVDLHPPPTEPFEQVNQKLTLETDADGLTPVFNWGGSGVDSICNVIVTDSLGVDTVKDLRTVTAKMLESNTAGNDIDDHYNYIKTYKLDYKWEKSPNPKDSGSVMMPGIPYQIVYDPPGDGSSASLTKTSEVTTSVKTNFGMNAGATLSFGYGFEVPLVASADIEVAASVSYKRNTENEFTATVKKANQIATSSAVDALYTGPGRGDVFLAPSLLIHWQLYRSWKPKDPKRYRGAGADTGYVYKIFYRPVQNSANTENLLSAYSLTEMFKNQPAVLAQILSTSAIDPATNRIRRTLVDANGNPIGSRLVKLEDYTGVSGGVVKTGSIDSSVTQAVTVSSEFDIGVEASAKITAGGASVGTKLSVGVTVGGSRAESKVFTRSMSYTISDANAWDYLRYRLYVDRTYGTYVFDVDSAQSWTSLPLEAGYSSPAIDWRVTADHDTVTIPFGQTAVFKLSVANRNRSNASALDTIRSVAVSAIMLSGAQVVTDPLELESPRGADRLVTVSVTPPSVGFYPVQIKLAGSVGQPPSQLLSLEKVVPLVVNVLPAVSVDGSKVPVSDLARRGLNMDVRVASSLSWILVARDLKGNVQDSWTGFGPQSVRLPAASGVRLFRLQTGSGEVRELIGSNL
jgi:hypothetical protein